MMNAGDKTKIGRTWSDLVAELIEKPLIGAPLLVLFLLIAAIWLAIKSGYISIALGGVKNNDPTGSSPYVYWYQKPTKFSMEQCAATISRTYAAMGADKLEPADVEVTGVAQVSVKGNVTTVLQCTENPHGAYIEVFAAGPDATETKTRASQLFQFATAPINSIPSNQ